MKRFTVSTLAAIMLLTVFASAATADNNNTTSMSAVEIRGPVYNGSTITDILANPAYGNGTSITMDANKFAALFYDINNNVTTESLSIKSAEDTKDRTIGKDCLVYQTTIGQTDYKYAAWGNYSVLGFFADKYIPLKSNDASKLAKLVLDSKDKYTLKTGDILDLGKGYSLTVKQVDVNATKVWLELDKDGKHVDDQIVSTNTGNNTWTCQLDNIQGENNVPVLRVHVNQVLQGAQNSIAQIEGLWLIDYANAIKISTSDKFGELNNVTINGPTITISNKDKFSLTRNSDQEIGQGMYFKVADSNDLRFYAFKKETNPGVYDIRGTVATGPQTWTADNFAGFFYDLNKNVKTEILTVSAVNGRTIPEKDLTYNTTIQSVGYKFKDFNGSYPVLGFFAEEYVPLKSNDASKLAKLVLDSKDKYTLKTGDILDLGKGYSLTVKQVDVNATKVWLEFDKDGKHVDDQIVSTNTGNNTWTCQLDNIQGENNVPVLKVHVNQVLQGAQNSIAQIEGLWLIDYANAIKISTSDKFGELNNVTINGPTITISNKDNFSLTRNSDKEIGQGMYFKVADSEALRYYPYIRQTIGGGNVTTPAEEGNVTTNATGNVTEAPTEENVTTTTTEGNATAAMTGASATNNTSGTNGTTPA